MMSAIRGKDTKPNQTVSSAIHKAGLRLGLHAKLPGKPDLVLPGYRSVVFVQGFFWHRYKGCPFATTPASNSEFWLEKFNAHE
jgi:DNA mismatch endonuclease, patch repair protein